MRVVLLYGAHKPLDVDQWKEQQLSSATNVESVRSVVTSVQTPFLLPAEVYADAVMTQ